MKKEMENSIVIPKKLVRRILKNETDGIPVSNEGIDQVRDYLEEKIRTIARDALDLFSKYNERRKMIGLKPMKRLPVSIFGEVLGYENE